MEEMSEKIIKRKNVDKKNVTWTKVLGVKVFPFSFITLTEIRDPD